MKIFLLISLFSLLLPPSFSATHTSAAPLLTSQDDCVANGGRWVGVPDANTGYCLLPVGNAITLATCSSDDEHLEQFYDTGILSSEDCYDADGSDGNDSSSCQYVLGGSFSSYGDYDYCTVTHDYIGDCPGQTTTYNFYQGNYTGFSCSGVASYGYGGNGGYPNYDQFKHHITDDDAGDLDMTKKNGEFNYDQGTCSGRCIISPSIPYPALKTLPDDATDKLYVRVVDENGNSAEGSYRVCFDLGSITNPIIYRYVGGVWISQVISVSGGQVCTTASGDGVFALGGNTDIADEEETQDEPAPYVYP